MPSSQTAQSMLSHEAVPPVKPPKPPNPHLGFLFSLLCPGWGEYHAGRKLQGALVLAVFLGLMTWFFVAFFVSAMTFMDTALGQLSGSSVPQAPLPLAQLAASLVLMVTVWLASMFRGTMLAMEARDAAGEPEQASQLWATFMAWICPGSGHVYGRSSMALAWAFLAANLAAFSIEIITINRLSPAMEDLASSSQAMAASPAVLVASIRTFLFKAGYDLTHVLGGMVRLLALAHTIMLVGARRDILGLDTAHCFPRKDDKWLWTLGSAGLNWLCPGCGQILQGRTVFGFALLGLFAAARISLAALVTYGAQDIQTLSRLDLIPTVITWAAILEAVVWGVSSKPVDAGAPEGS